MISSMNGAETDEPKASPAPAPSSAETSCDPVELTIPATTIATEAPQRKVPASSHQGSGSKRSSQSAIVT